MTFRSRKLLDLARDQSCQHCGHQDSSVVAAHSNLQVHGRGMSHKSHDGMHAWLCQTCHYDLDFGRHLSREEKREMFMAAMSRTYMALWDQGLIKVA